MPTFAERLIARMEPWNTGPKVKGLTDLERYLKGIAAMYEPFLALCEEEGEDGHAGYIPAWGKLFNPTQCPASGLAYLGQYVGVQVPSGATEAEARQLVKEHAGFERGTLGALEGAIRRVLAEGAPAFPNLAATDTFKRANEKPLSNGGKWEVISGASSTGEIVSERWEPGGLEQFLAGALWNKEEVPTPAVSIEVTTPSGTPPHFVAVWCCLSKGVRSGYRAVWTRESPSGPFEVHIEKWVAGARSILALVTGQSLQEADSIGISFRGEIVRAWRKRSGTWTLIAESAPDSRFVTGFGGLEANQRSFLNNFAIGEYPPLATNFLIKERTGPAAEANAYFFIVVIHQAITNALYEAINAVIPAGIFYKVEEGHGAWLQGTKQWSAIAAGKKWSEMTEGNY